MAPIAAVDPGEFLRESATTQSLLSDALRVGEPWISRQINGHARGPVAKFYDTLHALAEKAAAVGPRVNPGALVVGAIVVLRRALTGLDEEDLHRMVAEGMARETQLEADENVAEYRLAVALGRIEVKRPARADLMEAVDALAGYRLALVRECSCQVTLLMAVDAKLHALQRDLAQ